MRQKVKSLILLVLPHTKLLVRHYPLSRCFYYGNAVCCTHPYYYVINPRLAGGVQLRNRRQSGAADDLAKEERRTAMNSDRMIDRAMEMSNARLPVAYERATQAIAECDRIDECKSWSDKAAALASYARQADDKTLENYAMRIRSRAIKRAGELLKEFQPAHGANQNITDGAGTKVPTRTDAARQAGMSERQQVTAVRVANVPTEEFERQVESDAPPTITQLAEQGKKAAPPQPPKPAGFADATKLIGELERLAAFLEGKAPGFIIGAMRPFEITDARANAATVSQWLQSFIDQSREHDHATGAVGSDHRSTDRQD
ncbi:hypothetical protein [Rhizobium sp. Nf11,1]|uniref:hypothetical protein n=1 Tax=Rhizobium sp. Nf11,1 TaxID=3404923 RepID=UPI003D336B82